MMPEAQVLLANGKKVELLQQSKIVKDGLSKIPSNMLEYYTGGTSWAKDPAGIKCFTHLKNVSYILFF